MVFKQNNFISLITCIIYVLYYNIEHLNHEVLF